MGTATEIRCSIRTDTDVSKARRLIRSLAKDVGLSVVDDTKLTTAVSELSRNMLRYALGGEIYGSIVSQGARRGVRIIFEDTGPGIDNLELAMQDGYTTSGGMGLGLPGSKRLMSEFKIESQPGHTRVEIVKWK